MAEGWEADGSEGDEDPDGDKETEEAARVTAATRWRAAARQRLRSRGPAKEWGGGVAAPVQWRGEAAESCGVVDG